MPVRVWLPTLLRDGSDAEEIIREGDTLRDVLAGLGEAGSRVMNAHADRTELLRVYLNGAPTEDWATVVADGDEVVVLPPIRGGR
jgi:molybdopterin converting factor small subunit